MLEYESREDKWQRQTKAQYEALGRFVAAFESLVDKIRSAITYAVGVGGHLASRISIITHHDVMSAKPLFDVLRATVMHRLRTDAPALPEEEKKIIAELLKDFASRYKTLTETRNALLHGTWYIGWASSEATDFSEVEVRKMKVTADGLKNSSDAELIKGIDDLAKLRMECEALEDIAGVLTSSILPELPSMWPSKVYFKDNKKWVSKMKYDRPVID